MLDPQLRQLGAQITGCARQSTCPGVLGGRVTNDLGSGIPPRGLFLQPATASWNDIALVVLGLNPAPADDEERETIKAAASTDLVAVFEAVHQETLLNMPRWPYWRKMRELLAELGYEGKAVLSLELAFCENAPGVDHPGAATIRYCASEHLERMSALVPSGAMWLCVGAEARDWLARSSLGAARRWAWVEHVTGAWGTFERMFASGGHLHEAIRDAWKRVSEGADAGVCLSRSVNAQDPETATARKQAHREIKQFWDEVEVILDPPITRGGARAKRPQIYRVGTFARNVKIGVVAYDHGDMRVELWSTRQDRKDVLAAIAEAAQRSELERPDDGCVPTIRAPPKGESYLYLNFEWLREGGYIGEVRRVERYVNWFASLRDEYFTR